MNNVIKLSMIAALTMSSASVFAAAGDPVTGGSGSVTVDGTVQTNTCAVAVDKANLKVKILKADLDKSSGGVDLSVLGDTGSVFTLSNCSSQPIKVLITPTSGATIADMAPYWSIPGVNQVGYRLYSDTNQTVGATWNNLTNGNAWTGVINFTNSGLATVGMKLNPTADTATFPLNIAIAKRGSGVYNGPSTFSVGYTYNLTYL